MKRIALLLLAFCLYQVGIAQNITDVIYMNPSVQTGSPRFLATAGAFTALGNDFSGVHLNPAGLAVFRHNEFGIAMGAGNSTVSSTYYGSNQLNSWSNFLFANVGYTKRMTTDDPDVFWNFGVTFNRNSNLNSEAETFGVNPQSSLLDDWIYFANGTNPDDLEANGLVYEHLAYQTYLIDADANDIYSTQALINSTEQFYAEKINSQFNELGISLAADYSDKLYVGGSMNIPFYRYDVEYFYEEAGYGGDSIKGMQWFEKFSNFGIGINFKVGAIYRPIPNVRIGASIFTPTWMSITQDYETTVTGLFQHGGSHTAQFIFEQFEYAMRTSPQTNLGLAYVFGKNGFISVDYNFIPLRWSKSNTPDLSYLNSDVDDFLKNQHCIRFGAEIRLVSVYLRGGYSFLTNPYNLEGQDASRKTYAMGIGYRTHKFTLDLGYSIQNEDFKYYPYSQEIVQPAQQRISRKPLVASLSFRL